MYTKDCKTTVMGSTEFEFAGSMEQILLDALPCIAVIMRPLTREIVMANRLARQYQFVTVEQGENPCFWRIAPVGGGNRIKQHYEVELNNRVWDVYWLPLEKELCLLYAYDITGIRRQDDEFQRSRILASLGHLAGGIAHDFNNLLGGIYGYIDLAGANTHDERVTTYLGKALTTIKRARQLTYRILTFANGGAPVKHRNRLFPFIEERAKTVIEKNTNIQFECTVQPHLWYCEFDRNQIGLVVDNIITNAVQAMPDGGSVCINASNITTHDYYSTDISPGDYVQILFKDTGNGIPSSIGSHLFDPFYSTKPKSCGLGLAMGYSIIKKHGGAITVDSTSDKGTCFTLYLPASNNTEASEVTVEQKPEECNGIIVVIDDEEIMREIISEMLESFGYSVIVADEGKNALEYIIQALNEGEEIRGIIADLTIPLGMGGMEVISRLKEMSVLIPVVVSSGYAENPVMADPQKYGFIASVAKPFRRKELKEVLKLI